MEHNKSLNIIKAIYDKPSLNIKHNSEKLKDFSMKIIIKLSPLPFNIVLEALVRAIRQEKEIHDIQIGKKDINCHYLQMILCRENLKVSIKRKKES